MERARRAETQLHAEAWHTLWGTPTVKWYGDMEKWQAKAAFLMRSEVLGLREWLHKRNLTDEGPACPCGAPKQSVLHLIRYCPDLIEERRTLYNNAGSTNKGTILQTPKGLRAAAVFLLQSKQLQEFEGIYQGCSDAVEEWEPFLHL